MNPTVLRTPTSTHSNVCKLVHLASGLTEGREEETLPKDVDCVAPEKRTQTPVVE